MADRVEQMGWTEPKINGERLAELYTQMTGRRVTVSNQAISQEFRFVQAGPLTYGEGAQLLKVAALLEGFVFVPAGQNHDRLVVSAGAASVRTAGFEVYTKEEDLPEDERVVTYVMSLKNIKPDEAKRTFDSVIVQQNAYASTVPVPNASSVVITDNTSMIRMLIKLQQRIDVPSANVGTQFIKVQYADVTELSETLNQLVGSQAQTTQNSAGLQRVQQNPPGLPAGVGPGGAVANEASSGEQVPIQIVPNARTNEIFVMGRPADIVFVEGLVRGFDSQTDQKNFLRRKLKFLSVADFLPVAQQAIERTYSSAANSSGAAGGAAGAAAGGRNGGGANNTGRNSSAQASTRSSGTSSSSSTGSSSGSSGSGSSSGSSSGLGTPDVTTAPEALLVGRTLLVADNITNSIVIQGPPASLELVSRLLDEIDVKAEQVMISCVFGQLRLDDEKEMGVSYINSLATDGNKAIAGSAGAAGPLNPLSPSTAFNPGSLAASTGLGLYGKIGPYLNVYLNAMQTNSKFTVLSRPTIFTANNQKGTITSGTKIAIPTSSYTTATTGSSTNFEFRDVELRLEVIPLVNSAHELTLQIYLISQDLGNDREVGAGEDSYLIPDILNRELLTTVTVPNNETIVLGGLITSRDQRSKSGIPFLSQIPYVGSLFGTTNVTKARDELLIFIQPKIVNDSATLYDAQEDANGRYKVDEMGRDFIQGPGVLPNKNVTLPAVDPKASTTVTPTSTAAPEASGGPRRASSRPSGFKRP